MFGYVEQKNYWVFLKSNFFGSEKFQVSACFAEIKSFVVHFFLKQSGMKQ
jgi:hypothetical protein